MAKSPLRLTALGAAIIGAFGVGNASPAASGAGITFPAAQSDSSDVNTLDDYEEGAWTPAVAGLSTPGTPTYTTQEGRYTKIGRLVTCQMYLKWTALSGGVGQLTITGLPFAPAQRGGAMIGAVGLNAADITTVFGAYLNAIAKLYLTRYAAGSSASVDASVTTAGEVYATFSYMI